MASSVIHRCLKHEHVFLVSESFDTLDIAIMNVSFRWSNDSQKFSNVFDRRSSQDTVSAVAVGGTDSVNGQEYACYKNTAVTEFVCCAGL